jgi:hypothetical protein
MTAIAFTGHRHIRPQDWAELSSSLKTLATRAAADTWHTGGAAGLDELALSHSLDIRIRSVLHPVFQYRINALRRQSYGTALDDLSIAVCQKADSCLPVAWPAPNNRFQLRNEHMVDSADTLFAYYTGQPGGTRNCIQYALLMGKPVVDLMSGYAITHL